jgi:two-component system, LytTR family, response regulator
VKRATAVIVDDEPEAVQNIRDFLVLTPAVEILGEAASGEEALRVCRDLRPQIAFLDIQLSGVSGLEVAERISTHTQVIFTTAFERFALAAFELGAVDYLLKPFGPERLRAAVDRILERCTAAAEAPGHHRIREVGRTGPLNRIFARKGDKIVPIAVRSIQRIQSVGDYVEVVAKEGNFLLRMSLADLETRLDPSVFVRIHRSHLVRIDAVVELQALDDRRLAVALDDGTRIVASRSASLRFKKQVR